MENVAQNELYQFLMTLVKEGQEDIASDVIKESLQRKLDGSFDALYLSELMPRLYSIVRTECKDDLTKVMVRFASTLKY